jgi:hypothetical protein
MYCQSNTATEARASRVEITPGEVDWKEPSARVHRAVNVGKQPYEQSRFSCSTAPMLWRSRMSSPTQITQSEENQN